MRMHRQGGRAATPAENAVFKAWAAALAAELLLIFPLYGLIAGGWREPGDFLWTYIRFFPFLGGFVALGSIPVVFFAAAMARRFETALKAQPLLWAHLSAGLVFVLVVGVAVWLSEGLDLTDGGQRGLLLQLALTLLVAAEVFVIALPKDYSSPGTP
ncbi:hypothetical protein [Pseudoroseicyclus sp. CXY001]|uniref:hypothetical protein n=1 Tax=Pseudoroseicyclus sp. CXY001 TaxID=3242492 RepID=UPI00358DCC60